MINVYNIYSIHQYPTVDGYRTYYMCNIGNRVLSYDLRGEIKIWSRKVMRKFCRYVIGREKL